MVPMKTQWWEKPLRMLRRDYVGDFTPFLNADMEQLARETRKIWKANCEWIMATPGCAPGTAHLTLFNSEKFEKMPGIGSRDIIREYLPYARKYNINIIAYINMHWYSYEFAKKHPDWEQLLEDGTPYGQKHPLYGNGTTFCVNSEWRNWAFELIQEVLKTGVDGCFLDGPVIYPGACYCQSCKEKFREFSGSTRMPKFLDWNDPLWKKFAEFRANSWADFMNDAMKAARQINNQAVLFLNGGSFSSSNILLAYDTGRMEKVQSITGAEDFFHCTDYYRSPFTSLNLSRFLSAGKNPSVVFTHHTLSTWHYVPLPEAELSTALAQSTAGGSNTWFAIFYPAIEKTKKYAIEGLKKTGNFIERVEKFICGSESAAETGVLISNKTLYYYISCLKGLSYDVGSGKEQGLIIDTGTQYSFDINKQREKSIDIVNNENHGCLDLCNFAHIPVRVFWDEYINAENLRKIKCLILPNSACLSEKQIGEIMNFVHSGGVLMADFESGMYDEYGNRVERKFWLEFLGIQEIYGAFKPSRIEDYIILTKKLGDIDDGILIPRPLNALAIKSTENAEVIANYLNPINMAYAQPKGISNYPAIVIVKRGSGRVIYISSPIFESFNRFHIDWHKNIIQSLIRKTVKTGLQIETDAPGSLAIEIRKKDNDLLVHLVNVTSDMKRPMGCIIPVYNVQISLKAGLKKAISLSSGKKLNVRKNKHRLEFCVPEIREYEIILLTD